MTVGRHLDWDGCCNVRDLGGVRTADGRQTRWGAVVRADAPDRLTPAGWSALWAHGIRTIVDLRNDAERLASAGPAVSELATVRLALDDPADTEFWQHCWDNGLTARRSTTGRSWSASRSGASPPSPPSPTPAPAESWSTAGSAATAPGWSPCCCSRWSAWHPTTSPPTTS